MSLNSLTSETLASTFKIQIIRPQPPTSYDVVRYLTPAALLCIRLARPILQVAAPDCHGVRSLGRVTPLLPRLAWMPAAAGARGRSHAAAGGGDGNGAASAAVDPSGSANKPPMWTSTVSGAALGIALILLGCCANVMTLEILTTSVAQHSQANQPLCPAGAGRPVPALCVLTLRSRALCAVNRRDPGAGNLITFAQFLLIASEGVVKSANHPTVLDCACTNSHRSLLTLLTTLVPALWCQSLAVAVRPAASRRASVHLR